MALALDTIRAQADRVAASHQLEIVELEFSGGARHRTLRIFIEKNEAARAVLIELARAAEEGAPLDPTEPIPVLPAGVAPEQLSGVTHEDCASFTRDFGTLLDIEDLIPGAEYTLEVSSPGLERKLTKPADYTRFTGLLVKIQTFTPVVLSESKDNSESGDGDTEGKPGTRHFAGRLTRFENTTATLDLAAIKSKGRGKKNTAQTIDLPLANIEKANLIPEI